MPSKLPRPPYDPELRNILTELGFTLIITEAHIEGIRQKTCPSVDNAISGRPIEHEERTIPSPGGDLTVSIFRRVATTASAFSTGKASPRPGIYYTHGGGMIAGNRFVGIGVILDWVTELDAVCVSVEYRLPPEHPDPAPIEDCYAALVWTSKNAPELGINPDILMIVGSSAGGGLAAGTSLLARDRGGPAICAQVLICPMLDDRNITVSSQQYAGEGTWSRESNLFGWSCLLGKRRGTQDVSIYAAPARATDLSGLPSTFIDVGSAEVFRDEAVAYASLLWKSGVQAELHVWPGGFHGFDLLAPKVDLSVSSTEARTSWVRHTLSPTKKM